MVLWGGSGGGKHLRQAASIVANTPHICNDRGMARPRGESDAILAEWLRGAADMGGPSLSQLARDIGVAPSTVTRSIKNERFSAGLRQRLIARVGVAKPAAVDVGDDPNLETSLRKTLHLLGELQTLVPHLERRLMATLDRRRQLMQKTD